MAQDFVFKSYGTHDGLSHSLIKCFQEDDKGYLWIGTEYGLNKFDGLDFTTFLPKDSFENALSQANVSDIFKDSDGNLIVAYAYGGFSLYHSDSRTFINYGRQGMENLTEARVSSMAEDPLFLWVGTSKGLFKINKANYRQISKVPVQMNSNNGISNAKINALLYDGDMNLWIGTENGLNLLRKNTVVFEKYFNSEADDHSLTNNQINAIIQSSDKRIFIGTGYGLNELPANSLQDGGKVLSFKRTMVFCPNRPVTGIKKMLFSKRGDLWVGYEKGVARITPSGTQCFLGTEDFLDANAYNFITDILEDRWGRIYFTNRTTPSGLSVYHPTINRVKTYKEGSKNQKGLKSDQISSMYIDSNDFLWLGTIKNGFLKCNLNANPFHKFPQMDMGNSRFRVDDTYAITETKDGAFWIGTNHGLTRFDRFKGNPRYFHQDGMGKLVGNTVGSFLQDSDNRLWMGYYDYKVSRMELERERFRHYRYQVDSHTAFPLWSVRDIIQGTDTKIWFTSSSGLLAEYLPKSDGFKKHLPKGHETLFNSFGNALAMADGTLFIATNQAGLVSYVPETGEVTQYLNDRNRSSSISSNMLNSLCFDSKKRLWIGTEGGSLDRFDFVDATFEHFDLNLSRPYSSINAIEEDRNGQLWLGTNDGLVRFDPITGEKRVFTFEDGLPDNEFNRGASFKATDGTLLFGGPKGVLYFHPDSIQNNPYPPKVLLSAVHVSGDLDTDTNVLKEWTIRPDTIPGEAGVQLAYNENDIAFDFVIIHNAAPTKNILEYKLRGFDTDWKTAYSAQQFVEYTNLNPGTYTFQLKGENGDAKKSAGTTELRITIHPPFWKTLWFRFLIVAIAVAGIYGWYRRRTKVLRNQKTILEEEVALRTLQLHTKNQALFQQKEEISQLVTDLKKSNEIRLHFFTNISHELRTPLTLILGPVAALLKDQSLTANVRNQLAFVQRNSNRLLSLTNELLYIRKLESSSVGLHVERYDLHSAIGTIYSSFRSLAQQKCIDFEYTFEGGNRWGFVDFEKLTKILNNLLTNAFKYTPHNGMIQLIASCSEGNLSILVGDSGMGISKNDQTKIFERFYRGRTAASKNPDGAGIGLALTKELVLLHKGSIAVQSEPNKGAIFRVTLPILETTYEKEEKNKYERKTLSEVGSVSASSSSTHGKTPPIKSKTFQTTVLLVEDNLDMQQYIQSILTKTYKVITAFDGNNALEKIQKSVVDLVVSDVMMPNMNGFELCEKIKNNIETSHIPVLLLTAKTTENSKLTGLGTGADDYVTKPFHADMLLLKIGNIVNTRTKFKERFHREALAQPTAIELNKTDEVFLNKAIAVVEAHISDNAFGVAAFCKEMAMSKPVLNKKLTALTDLVPSKFIRHVRLKRAAVLIKNNQGSIREIMFETGFSNSSYFAKVFKKTFGINPADYLKTEVS